MKISKIEPQKRNKKRYSIYIDGEFKFGLSQETVFKYDLQEGDIITQKQIDMLLTSAEKAKIKNQAFRLLRYRVRSCQELRARLKSKGFDKNLIDDVIQELIEDNTLDDRKFAESFINDYTHLKPKGSRFIYRELLKKGISREIINSLIKKRDEQLLIRAFINKKLSTLDLKNPVQRQRAIRRLLNHGFTLDKIYEVLNESE